jgi:colanic acid biosynthesis glycosyl transferase WcaI
MTVTRENGKGSVTFLNRFYWPDIAATSQILTDLAEDLAAEGWSVSIIASRGSYSGAASELPDEEHRNGVRILRVRGSNLGRHRVWSRLADYLTFMFGALLIARKLPRQDAVVALSDPPFIVVLAVVLGYLRRERVVFWVQDLFPEIAARLDVMSENGMLFRLAQRLSRWTYLQCDLVVGLGPRMLEALATAGSARTRTAFVHNWADSRAIAPIGAPANQFAISNGLADRFVVMYSGNAGRAHNFVAVMDAARRLREDRDIVFVFIGGGKRTPDLRREVAEGGLLNVRFLDYVPREELAETLSAASVSLVTEEPSVVGLLVPCKTYGILASGRPLIFLGSPDSDVARIVEDANCGFALAPDDGASLARVILMLRDDRIRLDRLGQNAREAMVAKYDRRHGTSEWSRLLTTVIR